MPKTFKTPPKAVRNCCVCKKPCVPLSKYCPDCSRLYRRMRNKGFPPETVKAIWDYVRKHHGYVCYYTGVELDCVNRRSPWYCVFDHYIPGDPSKVVLTSALVNTMKSDQTEDEFWDNVFQLADYKRKHKKFIKKSIIHWYRLYPLKGR